MLESRASHRELWSKPTVEAGSHYTLLSLKLMEGEEEAREGQGLGT